MSEKSADQGSQKNPAEILAELEKRRSAVRLSTVFGGRISQFGRAYPCTVSDVSVGGAKIKLKDPDHFSVLVKDQPVQLVFERLSDYKALNGDLAWVKPAEFVVGLTFSDPPLRRRMVLKRLMPNRWRIANEHAALPQTEGLAPKETE